MHPRAKAPARLESVQPMCGTSEHVSNPPRYHNNLFNLVVAVGHSEDHGRGMTTIADDAQHNGFQYQQMAQGHGHGNFRGTSEDWNTLSGNQIKASVDSIAVPMSQPNQRNGQAPLHNTFRKGRFRQIGNNANTVTNVSKFLGMYHPHSHS